MDVRRDPGGAEGRSLNNSFALVKATFTLPLPSCLRCQASKGNVLPEEIEAIQRQDQGRLNCVFPLRGFYVGGPALPRWAARRDASAIVVVSEQEGSAESFGPRTFSVSLSRLVRLATAGMVNKVALATNARYASTSVSSSVT